MSLGIFNNIKMSGSQCREFLAQYKGSVIQRTTLRGERSFPVSFAFSFLLLTSSYIIHSEHTFPARNAIKSKNTDHRQILNVHVRVRRQKARGNKVYVNILHLGFSKFNITTNFKKGITVNFSLKKLKRSRFSKLLRVTEVMIKLLLTNRSPDSKSFLF